VAPPEFWQQEPAEERKLYRRQIFRWSLLFLALCGGVFFAFWWSGSAIHFGASRVTETTAPTYKVTGKVVDARTGAPVPWPSAQDDPAGNPPMFQALGDVSGTFELHTIPEPHFVTVSALGYRAQQVKVGRIWYLWMPSGTELIEVKLEPDRRPE
jgi:hypothetical protein